MFWRRKRRNAASAIGIIGGSDGPTAVYLSDKTGEQFRIIKRRGKTKVVVGRGLFKKTIKVHNQLEFNQTADNAAERVYVRNNNTEAMDIQIKEVDCYSPELSNLIKKLNLELMERYPKEHIYGVDFDDPKVREMTFAVAYIEQIPVGCGGLRPLGNGEIEIKRFFVDRSVRRHGIASKMLAYLEGKAKEKGFSVMKLETGPQQPEAVALYKKFGYYEIPLFGEYLQSTCEYSLCMEKKI